MTNHTFHVVSVSPWPLFSSFSILAFLGSFLYWEWDIDCGGLWDAIEGILIWLFTMLLWWRDVCREGTWEGCHTQSVQSGLRLGFIIFVISEVLFFASFFWCFFHVSLVSSVFVGGLWPPVGLMVFDPMGVPFLNTLILISSGCTITWCHYSLLVEDYNFSIKSLSLTLFLGGLFSLLQIYEYKSSFFSLSDSVYGSVFFLVTGFHGLHVLVGSLFILFSLIRLVLLHFSSLHHIGFELAAWYWHFVDVVWLFVYTFIYW